jgi:hypothetical protein
MYLRLALITPCPYRDPQQPRLVPAI